MKDRLRLMEITAKIDRSSVLKGVDGGFDSVEYFILVDVGKLGCSIDEFFEPVNKSLNDSQWKWREICRCGNYIATIRLGCYKSEMPEEKKFYVLTEHIPVQSMFIREASK